MALYAHFFSLAEGQLIGFGTARDFAQQFVDEFFDH